MGIHVGMTIAQERDRKKVLINPLGTLYIYISTHELALKSAEKKRFADSGIEPTTFWSRSDGITSTLWHLDRRGGLNRAIPTSIILYTCDKMADLMFRGQQITL